MSPCCVCGQCCGRVMACGVDACDRCVHPFCAVLMGLVPPPGVSLAIKQQGMDVAGWRCVQHGAVKQRLASQHDFKPCWCSEVRALCEASVPSVPTNKGSREKKKGSGGGRRAAGSARRQHQRQTSVEDGHGCEAEGRGALDNEPRYCVCNKTYTESAGFMVECEGECRSWFHPVCIGYERCRVHGDCEHDCMVLSSTRWYPWLQRGTHFDLSSGAPFRCPSCDVPPPTSCAPAAAADPAVCTPATTEVPLARPGAASDEAGASPQVQAPKRAINLKLKRKAAVAVDSDVKKSSVPPPAVTPSTQPPLLARLASVVTDLDAENDQENDGSAATVAPHTSKRTKLSQGSLACKEPWSCAFCTFVNRGSTSNCEVCGAQSWLLFG